jgi:hypothetical protein
VIDLAKDRLETTWNALTPQNIGEVDAHEHQQPPQIAAMTVAATVFEIIVTQPKSRGVFGFAKLPVQGDQLYLPSPRRGVSRYAVTDVVHEAHPEGSSTGSDAEPLLASVYVSFLEQIW